MIFSYIIIIFAIIYGLGFIGQLIYILFTPPSKLSTGDIKRKNILSKYLKKTNFKFYIAEWNKYFFFYFLPSIGIERTEYYNHIEYCLSFGWLIFAMDFSWKINKKTI